MDKLRGREKGKIQSLGGLHEGETTRWGYTPGGSPRPLAPSGEGGHHVPREPAELLLELGGRDALGPVDHASGRGPDSFASTRGSSRSPARAARPATPSASTPSRRVGSARGRARRAPRAALLVGVAHEAERREPLVALVVGRLDAADRLLARVGQVEARRPSRGPRRARLRPAVTRARVAVGARDLVEDLLAVERHHAP